VTNSSDIPARVDARKVRLSLFEEFGLKDRLIIGLSPGSRRNCAWSSLNYFAVSFILTFLETANMCTLT
jgi:hypothetical protein